ncbi:proton-coupled amino acid transporter-like protein pathetic [Leptopilina heterotoma]|uniref:proton-coupled amino acid transporter-like protein pathetic n=1 Tax=Leptopilina heterotoma TaxID=63436 RepID=UPI001CA96CB6|nr:proton-coupled amino acid transporter-like protein pathetic [Leptopilina heterotoma]
MDKNAFPLIEKSGNGTQRKNNQDEEVGRTEEFDPFAHRDQKTSTTDCDTLMHLLKACLGSGILSMPDAFKNAGYLMGFISTFLVAFICTHCSYILVKCAHVLYYRCRQSQMTFAEVAEAAFSTGPEWGKKFAKPFGYLIRICLFITYFGAVSVYSVIIAENFKQVLDHYFNTDINLRIFIACLLIPLILMCWIPNLKYLAPFSMVANGFMGISLAIAFYYLIKNFHPLSEVPMTAEISKFPNFVSITIFAIEAIGVIMPLENKMKNPRNFLGNFGILNKGMLGATIIYAIVGFMGYCAYVDKTSASITLNFPQQEIASQIAKIFIGLAVLVTFGLQFYVCLDIAWNSMKDNFKSRPIFANYILRTILVILSVLLAIAVPTISPFVGLIGAVCFTILGLLIPVAIEMVTFWDEGFGPCNWILIKNIIIVIVGLIAAISGANGSLVEIFKMYSK